jgi:hypothetical protein
LLLLLLLLLPQTGLSLLLEQQSSVAKLSAKIEQLTAQNRQLDEREEAALFGLMPTTDCLDQQQVCADRSSMQHAAFLQPQDAGDPSSACLCLC